MLLKEYTFTDYDRAIQQIVKYDDKYLKYMRHTLFPNDDINYLKSVTPRNDYIYTALVILAYSPRFKSPNRSKLRSLLNKYNGKTWDSIVRDLPDNNKTDIIQWFVSLPILTGSTLGGTYKAGDTVYNIYTDKQSERFRTDKGKVTTLFPINQICLYSRFMSEKYIVLTGDPGTGKTSQVPKLMYYFELVYGIYIPYKFDIYIRSFSGFETCDIMPDVVLSLPRKILIDTSHSYFKSSIGLKPDDINSRNNTIVPSIARTHADVGIEEYKKQDVSFTEHINKIIAGDQQETSLPYPRFNFIVDVLLYASIIDIQIKIVPCVINDFFPIGTYLPNMSCIIDEFHEHNIYMDCLASMIHKLGYRCILMSATIDTEIDQLKSFFYIKESSFFHLHEYGTPFPISTVRYPIQGDSSIRESTVDIIGAINKYDYLISKTTSGLVFVSSIQVVRNLVSKLQKPYKIQELHSKIETTDLPVNTLYISTPIAESSLTIEGLVFVIDTGIRYSADSGSLTMITYNSMRQRRGRTGRTMAGTYIALYDLNKLSMKTEYSLDTPRNYREQVNVLRQLSISVTDPEQMYIPISHHADTELVAYIRGIYGYIPNHTAESIHMPIGIYADATTEQISLFNIIFRDQTGNYLTRYLVEIGEIIDNLVKSPPSSEVGEIILNLIKYPIRYHHLLLLFYKYNFWIADSTDNTKSTRIINVYSRETLTIGVALKPKSSIGYIPSYKVYMVL